jgi:hypothetical protein
MAGGLQAPWDVMTETSRPLRHISMQPQPLQAQVAGKTTYGKTESDGSTNAACGCWSLLAGVVARDRFLRNALKDFLSITFLAASFQRRRTLPGLQN